MDSPLSTLGFVIFGITFSIYSVIAESKSPSTSALRPPSSPPRPTPPPPPPHHSPPPPPPPPHHSPPPRSPPYTHPPPPPRSSPRPRHVSPSPPYLAHADRGLTPKRSPPNPGPPASSLRMNWRKKVGLLFAGIAGIMQIGVVGFLVFKRRQLLRTKDAFEASG